MSHGNAKVIGLTGQTGAGKSTVSRVFAEKGFALIDADRISREVTQMGKPCLQELFDFFGDGIRCADGTLDRKALAGIVFTDPQKLESLNSICHPFITEEIVARIEQLAQEGARLILLDAPTLFESKASDFCDLIISVTAEESLRLSRIMARDGLTEQAALERMHSQLPEHFFAEHSDYIIRNNGTTAQLYALAGEVADKVISYCGSGAACCVQ